jgi:formylglycine-generating enzyme required for sulfatase activity
LTARMKSNEDTLNQLLDWLTKIGGIAAFLINILSLFLEEKPAKQISYGLAFLIPLTVFWHVRRSQRPETPGSQKSQSAAANRFLKSYLALFNDDRSTRIPYHRIGWIEKYASEELVKKDTTRELIKLSRQTHAWIVGSNIFAGIVLLLTLYLYITTNYAFNPGALLFGRNWVEKENPFIAMTRGDGTIIFGADSPDLASGEQPKDQAMPIDDFTIQKTEVTNRQYRTCRQAGVCKTDPTAIPTAPRYYEEATYDHYPVVGINAFQARQFCVWLGGDLPTIIQWERAARGINGRAWPWKGDRITPEQANLYPSEGILDANALTEGGTPEGLLNLVGNVAEWTRTQLVTNDGGESYLPEDWNGEDKDVALVIRGGSWGFQMSRVTELQIAIPENLDEFTGFRCVRVNL